MRRPCSPPACPKAARQESFATGTMRVMRKDKKELDVSISGAGSVSYAGDPKSIKKEISGAGSLEAKGP